VNLDLGSVRTFQGFIWLFGSFVLELRVCQDFTSSFCSSALGLWIGATSVY